MKANTDNNRNRTRCNSEPTTKGSLDASVITASGEEALIKLRATSDEPIFDLPALLKLNLFDSNLSGTQIIRTAIHPSDAQYAQQLKEILLNVKKQLPQPIYPRQSSNILAEATLKEKLWSKLKEHSFQNIQEIFTLLNCNHYKEQAELELYKRLIKHIHYTLMNSSNKNLRLFIENKIKEIANTREELNTFQDFSWNKYSPKNSQQLDKLIHAFEILDTHYDPEITTEEDGYSII